MDETRSIGDIDTREELDINDACLRIDGDQFPAEQPSDGRTGSWSKSICVVAANALSA